MKLALCLVLIAAAIALKVYVFLRFINSGTGK